MRERVARRYTEASGVPIACTAPHVIDGAQSTWAQYTIQVPDRDKLAADLKTKGVPTAIYYPTRCRIRKGMRISPAPAHR